jgi:hypothetical protein
MHVLPEKSPLFNVALGAGGRKDLKKKKSCVMLVRVMWFPPQYIYSDQAVLFPANRQSSGSISHMLLQFIFTVHLAEY